MRSPARAILFAALGAVAFPEPGSSQTSPFLPEGLHRHLVNEISGDRAFDDVRHLTHFHRTAGSRDFFAAAEWIEKAASAAGLEDVKLIRQKWSGHGWSCRSGEAWLVEPEEVKLASYDDVAVSIADHSRTTHVVAELIDVGSGGEPRDYDQKDVKGKVVLASGPVDTVQKEAVWRRGALGILSHQTQGADALDVPDQVAWGRLPYDAKDVEGVTDGTPSAFAVMISPRRARSLQTRMAGSSRPLRVKVDIEADYPQRQEQAMVEAWIRGSEIHDQQVVLTAHIQEEMTSANDDGSGCGNLLEIGRTLSRLIKEGKIPRPRRDIRFWWVNEFASEEQFFRENPLEPRKMLVAINQDMVGARQSEGGRVQYASRLPWSLPHALEDVMESALMALRDGNTALLTHYRAPMPQPFTREVVAVKGSREPFMVRMVPYFGHTDHHAFNPAIIGVPATTLTNWPDHLIHSTGDDLTAIDATQLERNAVAVAAVALYFAALREDDAPTLVGYVAGRGASRAAGDLATAVAHIASATSAERGAAFRAGRDLVRHSYRREMGAIASARRLSGRGRGADFGAQAISNLEGSLSADLRVLERAYAAVTGQGVPNVELTKEEQAMASEVFMPVKDIGAYGDALKRAKPVEGLHAVLLFEIYNFADGRRSTLDVYEAVAAEALSAGEWYYGKVKASQVREALERAAKAGAFARKKK